MRLNAHLHSLHDSATVCLNVCNHSVAPSAMARGSDRKVGLSHPTSRHASNALARLMEARVAKLHGLPYLGDHLRGRRSTRSTPTTSVVYQFVNTLSTGRFPNRLGWIPTLLCPLRWLKRCTEVPHASTLIVPTSTLSYSRPASLDLSYIRRP